jgi:hypothetical protein
MPWPISDCEEISVTWLSRLIRIQALIGISLTGGEFAAAALPSAPDDSEKE